MYLSGKSCESRIMHPRRQRHSTAEAAKNAEDGGRPSSEVIEDVNGRVASTRVVNVEDDQPDRRMAAARLDRNGRERRPLRSPRAPR